VEDIALALLAYINTGEGDWNSIKAEFDSAAMPVQSLYPAQPSLADLYSGFAAKLEPYGKNTYFNNNPESRKRFFSVSGELKEATEMHRAELLGLGLEIGFQKSLKYKIVAAAQDGSLALRVKNEMQDANLSANWLKDHIEELSVAILPCLKLVQEAGKPPRLKVDVTGLKTNTDLIVNGHYIQAREYRIGFLAVLRTLFGDPWNNPRVQGWVKDGVKPVEVDLTADQANKFFGFRDDLNTRDLHLGEKDLDRPPPHRRRGGVRRRPGHAIGGYSQKKAIRMCLQMDRPHHHRAGAGGLQANLVLKTRNQYISDGIVA
jgi:hypothetical protein